MKIYVASSWRNMLQPCVVADLRAAGHEVYDFKNPGPGDNGFHWSEIGEGWKNWSVEQYLEALDHPIAEAGFGKDMKALEECDACVLVLPSGKSAHIEAGYAIGAGKPTCIYIPQPTPEHPEFKLEPELMYKMASLVTPSLGKVVEWAEEASAGLTNAK
jgi:nucleoside 2-deoxyribosyltransferase